jgi:hypothetical protein
MAERMPQTTGWLLVSHCTGSLQTIVNLLSEVETRYCSVVASKFADPEMIIGGVMIPANIARANWESAGCFLKHLVRSRRGGGDGEGSGQRNAATNSNREKYTHHAGTQAEEPGSLACDPEDQRKELFSSACS